MEQAPIWVLLIPISLLFTSAASEADDTKRSLVRFMEQLLPADKANRNESWGWNNEFRPLYSRMDGHYLRFLNLIGTFDAGSLCGARSLQVLSLNNNGISGEISAEIANCKHLTHLYVSGNRFAGQLPKSISHLSNLKRVDISNNNFTGELLSLHKIPGLLSFPAQNNHFRGKLPEFGFANLEAFNVSNNEFSGQIPDIRSRFSADSFSGNPSLRGQPLPNPCPPSLSSKAASKKWSTDCLLVYTGYAFLSSVIGLFVIYQIVSKSKSKDEKTDDVDNAESNTDDNSIKMNAISSDKFKTSEYRSEYSMTSIDSEVAPAALVILNSSSAKDLKFEDLLRAPAELLGRGRHGTLYKVMIDDGPTLVVKRIKERAISSEEFKRRMLKMDQAKHPNVLPAMAFYCSKQEKLLVYEHQSNGSLFKLLHGSKDDDSFDLGSRLNIASRIAEALAFMHKELREDGIAHGNLKSTNILFNKNMDPCISEYRITASKNQVQPELSQSINFAKFTPAQDHESDHILFKGDIDIYSLGVILLELLTGKMVQDGRFDLATWVHSVIREEWTAEVFDRALIAEGVNEGRMVDLLQVALKCVASSPTKRPSAKEVSAMINGIKEEDERSITLETRDPSPWSRDHLS
ncbi:hypothetical protein ACJRO7_009506 [Eucalyptus globulus]|uniref:Protein kinase domain-containing protein n=1 Tax=Eucalyptus globulus TaxID=34317 RepID=A0ABD3L8W9_EUCGL